MLATTRSRSADRRENSRANDGSDTEQCQLDGTKDTFELEVRLVSLADQLV